MQVESKIESRLINETPHVIDYLQVTIDVKRPPARRLHAQWKVKEERSTEKDNAICRSNNEEALRGALWKTSTD